MAKLDQTRNVNSLVKQAEDLKENAVGVAHDIVENAAKRALVTAEYVGERVDDLKDSGAYAVKRVESHVKKQPLQSLAIAFGAGILAACLFGGQSNK